MCDSRESRELHDLAKRLGDPELELRAHALPARDRLALGEIADVDRDLAAFERLADLAAPAAVAVARRRS